MTLRLAEKEAPPSPATPFLSIRRASACRGVGRRTWAVEGLASTTTERERPPSGAECLAVVQCHGASPVWPQQRPPAVGETGKERAPVLLATAPLRTEKRKRKGGGGEPRRAATVAVAGRTPAGAVGHFPAAIAVTETERGGRGNTLPRRCGVALAPETRRRRASRARRPPPTAATGARDREWARQWLGFAKVGCSGWF
jgi:hypothetical protein